MKSPRLPAFLVRLVRHVKRTDLHERIEDLNGQIDSLRRLLQTKGRELEDTIEGCTQLEARVKELEEAEHLTEEDISLEIDTVIDSDEFGQRLGEVVDDQIERWEKNYDPWNDPSFTEQAEEHFENVMPKLIAQAFNSLRSV